MIRYLFLAPIMFCGTIAIAVTYLHTGLIASLILATLSVIIMLGVTK